MAIPKRKPAGNWWGPTVPTTGPTGASTTWVGNVFKLTVPGRLAGIRLYDAVSSTGDTWLAAIVDDSISPTKYVAAAHLLPTASQAARWHHLWFRPWVRIDTTHTYWVAAIFRGGGFFRTNNALSGGPVTHSGIQLINGFQSTTLSLADVALTTNANANAVDVMFYPD